MRCILLILIATLFFSSKKGDIPSYVILKGKIENAPSLKIKLLKRDVKLHEIKISESGNFLDTLQILYRGYYKLKIGDQYTDIYLKKGDNLTINLDYNEFDESLIYKGIGERENNYLVKRILNEYKFGRVNNLIEYQRFLNQDKFQILLDSLTKLKINFLKEYTPNLTSDFFKLESKIIYLRESTRLISYYYISPTKNKNLVSIYKKLKVDINDKSLLDYPEFMYYLESYLALKNFNQPRKQKENGLVNLLKQSNERLVNEIIKESFMYFMIKERMQMSHDKQQFFDTYMSLSKNENFKQKAIELFEGYKKVFKGEKSPEFNFKSNKGELISLSKLSGKPVVIDIWATWCKPCINQFSSLQKLEEKFESRVYFVSICVDSKKAQWLKLIEKYKLNQIQLFADKESQFLKAFEVYFPHFIIIDENGFIVNPNAQPPLYSNQIEEALKKM